MSFRVQKQRDGDLERFEHVNKAFEMVDRINVHDLGCLRSQIESTLVERSS